MSKPEPSLFRIAAFLVLEIVGIGSLKLRIPHAIAQYGFNWLSDGMIEASERQRAKLEEQPAQQTEQHTA